MDIGFLNNTVLAAEEFDIGKLIWIVFVVGMVIFSTIAEKIKKSQTKKKSRENYRQQSQARSSNIPNASDSDGGSVEDLISAVRRASRERQQTDKPASHPADQRASSRSEQVRRRMGSMSSDDQVEQLRKRRQNRQSQASTQNQKNSYEYRQQQAAAQRAARQRELQQQQAQRQQAAQQLENKRKAAARRKSLAQRQAEKEAQRQRKLAAAQAAKKSRRRLTEKPAVELQPETIQSIQSIDPLNPDLSDINTVRLGIIMSEILPFPTH